MKSIKVLELIVAVTTKAALLLAGRFLLRRRTHLPSSDGRALAGSLLFLPLFFGLNLLLLLDCGLLCFGRARRGHWGGSFLRQTRPHPCHLKKRCPAARAGRVGMGNPLALLCEAPIMVCCVSHDRCSTACKGMTNIFYAGVHGLMGCAQESHDSVGQALAIALARFCELDRGPGDQQYNRVFAVDQAQFL